MEDSWCHRTWLRLMINWHLPLFDLNHILISLSAHKVPFHSTMLFLNFQFQTEWRTLCHHLYDWQSPKSVSSQEQISPSLHVFFFQFLIWSSSGSQPSWLWTSGENKKDFLSGKIFDFRTVGWRSALLMWSTSLIFLVIISREHNRWIVGLFEQIAGDW